MHSTTIKRTMATVLSGVAIAGSTGAPAALAAPLGPRAIPAESRDAQVVTPSPPSSVPAPPASDAGLDLASAAIGAAAGTGLLIVVLTAGGLVSRRPIARGHRIADA